MARKYAVQFDECENRSKIIVWTPGVASYVDMQGEESGRAEAVTYTQAKREVLADRVKTLNHLKAEVKALRSRTKTQFDTKWDFDAARLAAYRAEVDAELAERDRENAEYAARLAEFEAGLGADIDADEKPMAVLLWKYGYWAKGWRPWGSRGATLEASDRFYASVDKDSGGDWSATVWIDQVQTETSIASGGLMAGIAWVEKQR